MEHTKECIDLTEKQEQLHAEWVAKYPNYCQSCYGVGGFHFPSTQWEPDSYDICKCHEDLKCSRCATPMPEEIFENDKKPFPCCGWFWGKNFDDFYPSSGDPCSCGQEEYFKKWGHYY